MSEPLFESKPLQPRKNRLFESGHLKLIVLSILEPQSRYGYEIIKAIADLVGGGYSPSTGTIYPTLNYLEKMNWMVTSESSEQRKQYTITDLGKQHLATQHELLQQILARFNTRREIQNNARYVDIYRAMENLKTALNFQLQNQQLSSAQITQIADHIDQAAVAITRLNLEEQA